MNIKTNNLWFEISETAKDACFLIPKRQDKAARGSDFWRLILDDGIRTEIPVYSSQQTGHVRKNERGLVCEYTELVSAYGDTYPITFRVEITSDNELLYFTPSFENHTEDVRINECFCPLADFDSLYGKKEDDILYFPEGMGSKIPDPWAFLAGKATQYYAHDPYEAIHHIHYPMASMSWFGIESQDHFLYIARYDKDIRCCLLTIHQRLLVKPGNLMVGIDHFPAARPGEAFTLPTTVVGMLDGDWRSGAKLYREWAQKNFYKVPEKETWVQGMTGWQRLIMRSQYGEDYIKAEDLPTVYKVGAKYGLHTIFLFGWWKQGLDRGYCEYEEPYPGAYEALKENVKKVQEMGGHIILVMPGHFMDASYEFYQTVGKDLAIVDINGGPINYPMGPYPGVGELRSMHGIRPLPAGCSCTQGWRDLQMEVLKKMNALGPQCLFMDCYGAHPAIPCFNDKHEHGNRIDAEWTGHRKSFTAAQTYCEEEGRVLGTEWVTDIAASYVQFIHSCPNADFMPGSYAFPAMFRYTFPEVIATNRGLRHSYGDYIKQFKWSVVMGLRMDAELWVCRVDIGKDPKYAAEVGKYTEILNKYADYMLYGTFTITGNERLPDCVKYAEYIHKNGGKLLRVLYNISNTPVEAFGVTLAADELYFEERVF